MKDNALSYLLITKLRNKIKSFFQKPVRIIYVLVLVALFGITIVGGNSVDVDADRVLRPFGELTAMLNALLLLIFSITFYSGLSNGGSCFKMADVNLLFPSPLNKRSVLFYALIQQMGSTLLIGFFILFQYTMLHSNYGVTVWGLLLICLVYSLAVFASQTLAMFVYTLVSDSDRKKRFVKLGYFALLGALAIYVGLGVLKNQTSITPTLVDFGNSLPVLCFPFAGWLGGLASGVFLGSYLTAALWLAVSIGAFAVILIVMARSKREYYEDVLASAEIMQSAIVNAKDGVSKEYTPRNIKVGNIGISKGWGVAVFFYKHLLENRRSTKFILSPTQLTYCVITIIFSIFLRGIGIMGIFAFSAYMMIFTLPNGRFNRELLRHYIYMIPEPSTKKMAWALAETMPTVLLEAVVTFIPLAFIVGASPVELIFCILAWCSYGALFTAGNVAVERIWGGSISKVAGFFVYLLVNLVIAIPGIALAILLPIMNVTIISTSITALIAFTICNIPVSLFTLFLCRNMLTYAEINS